MADDTPRIARMGDLADWGVTATFGRHVVQQEAGAYTIVWYADEEAVEYGDGRFVVPKRFWALWEMKGGSGPRVTLRLEIESRQLVCTQFVATRGPGDPPLNASQLRAIPFARLVEASGNRAAFRVPDSESGTDELRQAIVADFEGWREAYAADARSSSRGKRLPDEHLQRVAEVYRDARLRGQPPVVEISKTLHTSRSNAGRWVMEARRRGFLGEAPTIGKAGEKEEDRG